MSALDFDTELQALREKSVDRLLMAEVFDAGAFDDLLRYLDHKAQLLRSEYAISKQVLACLRGASEAILSRAEYVPAVKTHIEKAARFSMLLDLMIIGETLEDRSPGVPRVI